MDFSRGFTVLTGETGAGKSMIVDAINLLLGKKPPKDIIRTGERSAMVSGYFTEIGDAAVRDLAELGVSPDEDGALLLQRNITAEGKSQTKLNGRTIPVSLQREIAGKLIDIHGQHDNQKLLNAASHRSILDEFAHDDEVLQAYREQYRKYASLMSEILELQKKEKEKARLTEMLAYQIADIDGARLKEHEEEELEKAKHRLLNYEKTSKYAKAVYRMLYRSEKGYAAYDLLEKASAALIQLTDILPDAGAYAEKLDGMRFELEDIGETVYALIEEEERAGDLTSRLDKIESRLDTIAKLRRKYGESIREILMFREKASAELAEIEEADLRLEELSKERDRQLQRVQESAAKLTDVRKRAAVQLEKKMIDGLAFLDMQKVHFRVDIQPLREPNGEMRYSENGADAVEFMIATNPGEPLRSMSQIASGGELARIMLSAKCAMADKDGTGTVIFDEVDTGVSGKTSHKIGLKLHELSSASQCQVLCVTHSAQIAAVADHHFLIAKDEKNGRMETSVLPLQKEGRVREIARIMGGMQTTETLLHTAEEMLEEGSRLSLLHTEQ